ncbi:CDP-diacylglycerol--serine O-phosphatidyltransferase [Priestia filamentosa]|uniref:CDP-diacylglycerol--serine O-phosphatidyltransferase n=1 Tax=Priestia filamentosa TaxID=1402861 RepID=UPI003983517F
MITIGNFICGILAVHFLIFHHVYSAVTFIFVGVFFDFFDGIVARRLNAVSEIGKELDSLADLVTFSIAPAMLAFSISLHKLPFIGLLSTLAFSICGMLRLARFNTNQSKLSTFIGMPTPLAAICLILLSSVHKPIILAIGTCGLSYLMISQVKFPHFKNQMDESLEITKWN